MKVNYDFDDAGRLCVNTTAADIATNDHDQIGGILNETCSESCSTFKVNDCEKEIFDNWLELGFIYWISLMGETIS